MENSQSLRFEATKLLHTAEGPQRLDIRFSTETGRLLAIYGPSGAGKTTLLRILAGLTEAETGLIQIENETWLDTSQKIDHPTRRRPIGFVFQDFALFPNLTVRGQLEYAVNNKKQQRFIDELLEMMELTALQQRKPIHLSGGQQQRVALARAIARKPRLLLLDEPLSALDDEMRLRLQDYILKAHRHFGLTTFLVTHHIPEIFRLADEVLVLDKGRIQRQGAPAQLFLEEKFSSTFQITGEIIGIQPSDIVYIISILSASNIVRVIATTSEASLLHIGQKVLVASPAFNPILIPLDSQTR